MIRINLLPEEYRKKARTPVKLLLGIAAAVLVNGGLATWWGWALFGEQAAVDSEKASLQTEMDGLTPQVTHYHGLEAEKKQYQTREQTLSSITNSRVSWTRKMDELIDVVNRGGDGQRHLVWFDDLNVTQGLETKGRGTSGMKATAHSGSEKYAQIANFLEDLESSPFISDFLPPAAPEGSQAMVDESLVPSVAWSFPLTVTLKPTEERMPKNGAAKPADDKAKNAKNPKAAAAGAQAPATTPGPQSAKGAEAK